MDHVRKTAAGTYERVVGNPTLTSLDGEERAPLRTVIASGKEAAYGVYDAQREPIPEGKVAVGPERIEERDGLPVIVTDYEDAPPPPPPTVRKSTVQARLIEAGAMEAAYVALTSNPEYFARWFAPDRPVVNCDDPDAILVVTALGLDPETILAPE